MVVNNTSTRSKVTHGRHGCRELHVWLSVLFVVFFFLKFSPFSYGSERRKLEEQNKSKNGINIKGQDNMTDSEMVDEETD